MASNTALTGKFLVTLTFPETLQELIWRVSYMRRNRESWRLLVDSFKPSTTDMERDLLIKDNTLDAILKLEKFYEAAATFDPRSCNPSNPNSEAYVGNFARAMEGSGTDGRNTDLSVEANQRQTRVQSVNPISQTGNAAENIVQDVTRLHSAVAAVFNSYGIPYTETRGEVCHRWIFESRNTAFKAIALLVQECPWLMQIVKSFDFFTADVVSVISNQLKATTQLYGHLESADETVDSPRHLLTPLWSDDANITAITEVDGEPACTNIGKKLDALGVQGKFTISHVKWTDAGDVESAEQDLLAIYCEDTYGQNAQFTNETGV